MMQVQNIHDEIEVPGGNPVQVSTISMLRECLNVAPDGGFTVKDIRARSRVDAALDGYAGDGVLYFEDADFETARACVSAMRWRVRHEVVERFLSLFSL